MVFCCADKTLDLSKPIVMGILNLTPDSFYDGGHYLSVETALARTQEMLAEGAQIIDVGAESSRPEAVSISLQEELDRLMEPFVAIKQRFDVVLSVDTCKPAVMQEAIGAGVHMINDVLALRAPNALDLVAQSQVGVCLMHWKYPFTSAKASVTSDQTIDEVTDFLHQRVMVCERAGISKQRLVIDPGFGFGKSTVDNLSLLRHLTRLKDLGLPILAGLSRKHSIGDILSLPKSERLFGSLAAHLIAAIQGVAIIRTHDVKPTVETLKVMSAVFSQEVAQ